ncbi:hypothetical protein Tco_1311230 [Tanacetum coccineum]
MSTKKFDAPLIEEWVSDNEDEVESPVVVKKKTVFYTAAKIEFVRPKQHEKPVRKPVKYTEMYMSQRPRENQRNWNNQKSQQLGSVDDLEYPSKQGRNNAQINEDHFGSNRCTDSGEAGITVAGDDSVVPTTNEEITLAQTLIQIKAAKPKVVTTTATTATTTRPKDKGVVVQEPSEFRVPQEIKPSSSKDKGKEIVALKKRIQRLERRKISRPIGLKRLRKVGMSQRVESSEDQESLGVLEDASKQGRSIADIDADVEIRCGKMNRVHKSDEQSTKTNDNTDDSLAERLQSESFKLLFIYSMAGEDEFHDDNTPPPPPLAMKMEHYLEHTDYPIWEVIQKGNGPVLVTTDTNGQIKVLPPKTAEEILARERERKARTTLLMAIPEDHLAKFHKMTDAKEM